MTTTAETICGLTDAERKTLAAVADHGSYKAASQALICSSETVKSHMKNIRLKLDAKNTTNAVAIGIREGLI